jgi:hypothetical protein
VKLNLKFGVARKGGVAGEEDGEETREIRQIH